MRSRQTSGNRSSLVPAACAAVSHAADSHKRATAACAARRRSGCMLSAAAITVRCGDEFVNVAGLEGGMARIRNETKISLGPSPVQIPCSSRRANHVVASLHDRRRNVPDTFYVVQQLHLAAQETAVHEVMAFDASHGESELVLAPFSDAVRIAAQKAGRRFPHGPRACGCHRRSLIGAGEALIVGIQVIVALIDGNGVAVGLPVVREELGGAVLIEPAYLGIPEQENTAQNDLADPLRIGLGVGKPKRAAPRPSEHQPALDAQMLAQAFDVGHEVPGGVLDQAGARAAAAAAPLIEYDDAVVLGIEELPGSPVGAGSRSAVQKNRRFAGGVAALFVIDLMQFGYPEETVTIRFNRRVESALRHGGCRAHRDRRTGGGLGQGHGACRDPCSGLALGGRTFDLDRGRPPRHGACRLGLYAFSFLHPPVLWFSFKSTSATPTPAAPRAPMPAPRSDAGAGGRPPGRCRG